MKAIQETNQATAQNISDPNLIHKKLKAEKSNWSYAYPVSTIHGNGKHQLHTSLLDDIEFAIYEIKGGYFVLIDFAKDYSSLNDDAKKIIDANPKAKASILAWEKEKFRWSD
ncbi:TPA: hypothetical protein ACKP17_000694 [Serratia marcescens]